MLESKLYIKIVFIKNHANLLSQTSFPKPTNTGTKNAPFKPDDPHFPNPNSTQNMKSSFTKGLNDVKNINHWLEQKGKNINLESILKRKYKLLTRST